MISNNNMKFVGVARQNAINNDNGVNSKHGAVIVKQGKIVCGATNNESLHAEMNCIKRAHLKGS